jgi:hypothetical protein
MSFIDQKKAIEAQLLKKAHLDKKFEALLLSNPAEALKQLGVMVPQQFHCKVVKEKKDELILVYPEKNNKDELSELELVSASGGSTQDAHHQSRM